MRIENNKIYYSLFFNILNTSIHMYILYIVLCNILIRILLIFPNFLKQKIFFLLFTGNNFCWENCFLNFHQEVFSLQTVENSQL